MGYFGKEENLDIAEKMRVAFSEWINNGHNNFEDENTYEIKQWFVPVAAARLSEWLTEHEKERLLKLIRKHLYE